MLPLHLLLICRPRSTLLMYPMLLPRGIMPSLPKLYASTTFAALVLVDLLTSKQLVHTMQV